MKKTDNVYMDAINYGVANMATGTSLNEMKDHLSSIGWVFSKEHDDYFNYWFFSNFYHQLTYRMLTHGDAANANFVLMNMSKYFDTKLFLTSEAFEVYQSFQKLKQAKEDSKIALNESRTANRYARLAFYLAITVGLIQISLEMYSTFKKQ